MNLGFDLSMNMQQKLSFQMIQSLKLLQANTLQLEQRIQSELALNPLLEAQEDVYEEIEDDFEVSDDTDDGELMVDEEDINMDSTLEDGFEYNFDSSDAPSSSGQSQETRDYVESLQTYESTLEEHVRTQLEELDLNEEHQLLADFLVGSLDENGYLAMSTEEIAQITGSEIESVDESIYHIQCLEPAGIGAQSLQECLMLQLVRKDEATSLAYRILDEQWHLFERLKIPALARKLDVSPSQIQEALEEIKQLDPKPGRQFIASNVGEVIPDLIVENLNGKLIVAVNDRFMPNLRINQAYSDMLRRRSSAQKDVKSFIRERFNSANWLIRAVEQRRTTMLRVMDAIIARQPQFFNEGQSTLNPLKLQDIADTVEMHVSTISRVTSNKYVQTPYGIFELKHFFSEALGQNEAGEDISTANIKSKLKEIIEVENRSKPLSDQKLSELMTKEGYALARRTVAKYREQLGIPTARMRKTYE